MISSVIATLAGEAETKTRTISTIMDNPLLEVGELIDGYSLPVTIDSSGREESEEITKWLLAIEGVADVNVVFVHFEQTDGSVCQSKPKTEN